jgi:RNA polymerase sigma factor (sigma-70 family)
MVSYLSEIFEDDPEEARITSWYITGIKHEVLRIAKKRQKLKQHEVLILNKPIDDSEGESIEMIDTIADSSNTVSKIEEKIDIEQVLSHLTFKQQKVIKMIFLQEKTEKEVAEKLRISQPAVHRIKNRALRTMKGYMKKCMN